MNAIVTILIAQEKRLDDLEARISGIAALQEVLRRETNRVEAVAHHHVFRR